MDGRFGWMKLEREDAQEGDSDPVHEVADLAAQGGEVGVVIPEVRNWHLLGVFFSSNENKNT